MPTAKITKSLIDSTECPETGKTVRIMDTELKGFGVDIGRRTVTFFVRRNVGGRTGGVVREKIGEMPGLAVAQARELARTALGNLAEGRPARVTKRVTKAPTLGDSLDKYLAVRAVTGKPMKASTAGEYRQQVTKHLKDWLARPITEIKRTDVRDRHLELSTEVGPFGANRVMDYLSAILNWASEYYGSDEAPLIPSNPCRVLIRERQRNDEPRRQTFVRSDQIGQFWTATHALPDQMQRWREQSEATRDLLLLMLFTGMRPGEACRILVESVDLDRSVFVLHDPKRNGAEFWIPFAAPVKEILARRIEYSELSESPYVFPALGHHGESTTIRTRDHIAKLRKSLPNFKPGDLRRTFTTVVGNMDPAVPAMVLKRLLNHKNQVVDGDVTSGYYGSDVDALRPHVERIAARIIELATPPRTAE